MALFFDHQRASARQLFPARRVPQSMPHHICLRLAGGWLAALTALLALVLAIRWYG